MEGEEDDVLEVDVVVVTTDDGIQAGTVVLPGAVDGTETVLAELRAFFPVLLLLFFPLPLPLDLLPLSIVDAGGPGLWCETGGEASLTTALRSTKTEMSDYIPYENKTDVQKQKYWIP